MIKRELYLEQIDDLIGKDIIKVITGVRRSGKSVFLRQVMDQITSPKKCFLNFESLDNAPLLSADALYQHLIGIARSDDDKTYIFLDEIQMVDGWEKVVASVKADADVDVYITGSNAKLLSGELATLLAGRYVTIEIYPFSYAEYRCQQPGKSFNDFIVEGGMPMLGELGVGPASRADILEDMFNSVVLKDIVARHNVRDTDLLARLITYVMSEFGRVFSANSISNYLKTERRSFSNDTLMNYLRMCQDAYLFAAVPFHDVVGKRLLKINEKYYVVDHGLRNAIVGRDAQDIERVLENIVYYELRRRGYSVTVGRNGPREIDFVATAGADVNYFQVCYLLGDEDTRAREFGAFRGIADNYPKYVLSTDQLDFSQNGIIHQNLEQWLLGTISVDGMTLPPGWRRVPSDAFRNELAKEIHPAHPLYQQQWVVVADHCGISDDVLVQMGYDQFLVVHLTWRGSAEYGQWPTISFQGTLAQFQAFAQNT
ncbi:MAG: ATP-binding protein [Propionibacteriaceae bacterium]|nr:ATP-binding protein [Propionibacteriaceae bacterium]